MERLPGEYYGGIVAGIIASLYFWVRVDLTFSARYPLDVSAVLITGILLLSVLVGLVVYVTLGGDLEGGSTPIEESDAE